jgi:hypothetical protein
MLTFTASRREKTISEGCCCKREDFFDKFDLTFQRISSLGGRKSLYDSGRMKSFLIHLSHFNQFITEFN